MARGRILIVEDEDAIREGVRTALSHVGFATVDAADGRKGLDLALTAEVDLVLLDLRLPELSGLEVLDILRDARPTLPVIALTALGGEDDRVEGLRRGADDYVVKPFSVRELVARIEAVLRRTPERPTDLRTLAIPGGAVDFTRREVRFEDGVVESLAEREAELLRYLATRPGRIVSREELLQRVWGLDPRGVRTRAVDMAVVRLRERLRDASGSPRVVRTVRGRGYLIVARDPEGAAS